MKRLSFFFLTIVTILSSCHFVGVKGNGNIKSENRSVGPFTSIDAGGSFEVHLVQGPAADIRIETDENLLEYIVAKTDGDELKLTTRDNTNLNPTGWIKVYVSTPSYKKLTVSGASRLIGDTKVSSSSTLDINLSGASGGKLEIDAPELSLDLTGASGIELKGDTKKLSVEGSGASHINGYGLMTENAEVDLSGASNAEVFASVSLKIEASGASHVSYKGNPSVNQNTSGASSVRKAD